MSKEGTQGLGSSDRAQDPALRGVEPLQFDGSV